MPVAVDLVVPIKELRRAKSRLVGATAGLGRAPAEASAAHADLALALAADTLAAVLASAVRRVAVVTTDPRAAALVRPERYDGAVEHADGGCAARAVVVDDPAAGLNAAVRAGVEELARAGRGRPVPVAALLGDLPALRPAELDAALARAVAVLADGAPAAFVADHTGEGTTLLVLARPGDAVPHFGPHSARAHAAAGAVALAGDWPGLRHDVDVPADLERVRALGVGPATRAWPDAPVPAVPLAGCR
ncbi:2-phospho-L-lactate guanylyltransferase [Actinomycetospora sp. TBRC 11914]|uniref:2-phospho-L-lactate guanylyltransferase n=1 Tax=Actinomycetospora sp. TBRC 11914 TaxID=2729387 RepID=UPI001B7D6F95|nr:2-phospho-L-lactate guanylyltransferase [Actinomycetospora sp. TBRC 11914]